MKKAEYIQRYGLRKYQEHKERAKENQRKRIEAGKQSLAEKDYVKDSVTVKAYLPVPDVEDYAEQLVEIEKEAYRFQNYLKREWARETNENFILVVDSANKEKGGRRFIARVNLTQLRMPTATRDKFKEIVKSGSENWHSS